VVRLCFRADPSLLWDRLVLKHLAGYTYLRETEVGEVYPLVLSTPPLLHIEVVPLLMLLCDLPTLLLCTSTAH